MGYTFLSHSGRLLFREVIVKPFALGCASLVALSLIATTFADSPDSKKPRPAASPRPLVIRYVWFSATPKPGQSLAADVMPTVFQRMQDSQFPAMSDDPNDFLKTLNRLEPRYSYRLYLSGAAAPLGSDFYRISGVPKETDPLRHAVGETIRVIGRPSPNALRVHRKGRLDSLSPESTGLSGSRWDDSALPEGNLQPLGTTRSLGVLREPSGRLTVYAVSFSEEVPSAAKPAATTP
jgi:hypothetical protein